MLANDGGSAAWARRNQLVITDHRSVFERSMILRLAAVQQLRYDSREKAVVELEGRAHPLELRRRAALRLRQALDGASSS
jgi:hypothetical protein